MDKQRDFVLRTIEERGVKFVRLWFTDVIGTLKSVLGMRKFLRRGIAKVGTEWRWACTAFNIGVLLRRWEQTKAVLR